MLLSEVVAEAMLLRLLLAVLRPPAVASLASHHKVKDDDTSKSAKAAVEAANGNAKETGLSRLVIGFVHSLAFDGTVASMVSLLFRMPLSSQDLDRRSFIFHVRALDSGMVLVEILFLRGKKEHATAIRTS